MKSQFSSTNCPRTFTVVIRASESMLRIAEGRGILVSPIESEHGPYELRIRTRSDQAPGIDTPIPREIWFEASGPAPSMDVAIEISAAIVNDFSRQVAFAGNSWQGLPALHLAYETTSKINERKFIQNWLNDERGLPRPARQIDPDLMLRFLEGLARCNERERPRIIRAITQYSDALQHWRIGGELYALSHLYMGVEAITPTAIRAEMHRRGMKKRRALEEAVLRPIKYSFFRRVSSWLYVRSGGFIKPLDLDTWARRQLIFLGDEETFKTARAASDQLEHGLAQHDEVHRLAEKCVEKCAQYLRQAILRLISLDEATVSALCEKPYTKPARTSGLWRQLHATIISDSEDVSASDQSHPFVTWSMSLTDFRVSESGAVQIKVKQSFTPSISQNAKFRIDNLHISGPGEIIRGDDDWKLEEPKNSRSEAGIEISEDDPKDTRWSLPVGRLLMNCNAIRYMSVFWIFKITDQPVKEFSRFEFNILIAQLIEIINSINISEDLRQECLAAWRQVIEFDLARAFFAECVAQREGILSLTKWEAGKSPLLDKPEMIDEVNNKVIEMAKHLSNLLDRLLFELGKLNASKDAVAS